MADFDPRQMTDSFLAALREFHSGGKDPAMGGGGQGTRKTSGIGDTKSLAELGKEVDKLTGQIKGTTRGLNAYQRMMEGQGLNYVNLTDDIERLGKALDEASKESDLGRMAVIKTRKEQLELTAVQHNAKVGLNNFAMGTAKAFKQSMIPAVGSFVKALQTDASATSLSTTLFSGAIDTAAGAGNAAGAAMGAAGTAMAGLGGKAGKAGIAMAALGPIVQSLSTGASNLAKFGMQVIGTEVERASKAFHDATNAGALFADGVTGAKNAALSAGLTTDQFAKVLQQHSGSLAAAGMDVGTATKLMGGAMKAGGVQMKTELMKLGYGFEEQAGLVAETMANMRQSGEALTAGDQAAIAQQTGKYAENLRIISSITGEDARKKMAAVKEQAAQLAFQQKLAGMESTQRDNVINAMANMSDQQRKNFMETMVFGQTINKAGAAMEATSSSFAANNQALVAAAEAGTLDANSARSINAEYAAGVKSDMLANKEIGMAGMAGIGGIAGELSTAMGTELQYRNKWNAAAIKGAEAGAQGQKTTNDELTNSLVGATTAGQQLKLALQDELSPAIKKFSDVTKETLEGVRGMLASMGVGDPNNAPEKKTDWGTVGSGALTGASTGAMVGSMAGPIGTAIGAALGGVVGGFASWWSETKGHSVGGIVEGDPGGFLAKLHGKELIIPLKGNEPVKDSKGYEQAMKLFGKDLAGSSSVSPGAESSKRVISRETKTIGDMQGVKAEIAAMRGGLMGLSGTASALSNSGAEVRNPERDSSDFVSKASSALKDLWDATPMGKLSAMANSAITGDPASAQLQNQQPLQGKDAIDSPLSRLLEEQLMTLNSIADLMSELNSKTADAVDHQRTIAENTF
jgi:hypothetical protein